MESELRASAAANNVTHQAKSVDVTDFGAKCSLEDAPPRDLTGKQPHLFVAGMAIAFIGSMCGIGGGLFTVPVLHFGFRMSLRRSVATSLCLVFATTSSATVAEMLSPSSAIVWPLVGCLMIGTLLGAQIGYPLSKRFNAHNLRGIFSIVIMFSAYRVLFGGAADDHSVEGSIRLTSAFYAAGAGFLGGFVSPILGIGGGLVTVPALLLGPSALTYQGMRACSMATAVVTSGRSLSLYWKERGIHQQAAIPLSLGAIVGAALGVTSVHQPGVITYARLMLGVILFFVSLRFAWAWWKGR